MPQGPPGPQGSPHPQPPPPNSMMGPHSQVMLRLSLFFSFLGVLVLSADASYFGIHHSSRLHPVLPQTNTKCRDIYWSESHGALLFFVTVLHVASFCWRPKRPPHTDGQSGRSCMHVHILNTLHHVYRTAFLTSLGVVSVSATRGWSWSSSHSA